MNPQPTTLSLIKKAKTQGPPPEKPFKPILDTPTRRKQLGEESCDQTG